MSTNSLFFVIGVFPCIKDNSNNKGWGKVDKNEDMFLEGQKHQKVAGENFWITVGEMGKDTSYTTPSKMPEDNSFLSPKQSTKESRVEMTNPHNIHMLSTGTVGKGY